MKTVARTGRTPGVNVEKFGSDVANLFDCTPPGLRPLVAAEPVQRRVLR